MRGGKARSMRIGKEEKTLLARIIKRLGGALMWYESNTHIAPTETVKLFRYQTFLVFFVLLSLNNTWEPLNFSLPPHFSFVSSVSSSSSAFFAFFLSFVFLLADLQELSNILSKPTEIQREPESCKNSLFQNVDNSLALPTHANKHRREKSEELKGRERGREGEEENRKLHSLKILFYLKTTSLNSQ